MESGSKLDPGPETESGSDSLIAKIFYLSFFLYRSTVLLFLPSTQKENTVLPGADQLRRVQSEPSLDSPWRSRQNFVGFCPLQLTYISCLGQGPGLQALLYVFSAAGFNVLVRSLAYVLVHHLLTVGPVLFPGDLVHPLPYDLVRPLLDACCTGTHTLFPAW
jgi:hypothetical protein